MFDVRYLKLFLLLTNKDWVVRIWNLILWDTVGLKQMPEKLPAALQEKGFVLR